MAILNFWARAIKFNKRRKLWKFVRSAWFDYDSEFQNLEVEMQRHRDGVEKAAIAQHISDDSANRTEQKQFNQCMYGVLFSIVMSFSGHRGAQVKNHNL